MCVWFVLFFFFKKKTAYEMRISDWSSDVCSSDLFRFEKLKIDRSLVVDAGEDDGSRAMMLSSVTVAHALRMGVTAEGVETEEQAILARAAGCDRIQGWLFHKAMPVHEITSHLNIEEALRQNAPLRMEGQS